MRGALSFTLSIASSLIIECRPLTALGDIVEPWQALAARSLEPNVFYEPSFALAAAPHFGPDVHALLVWSSPPGKRLLGLFPMRVARRYGFCPRLLTGWIHPFSVLGVPLVDRDEPEETVAAWLDGVAGEPALPNVAMLPAVSVEGPFAAALERVLADRGIAYTDFGLLKRALLAPGGDRANYLAQAMGAKHRKELPRRRRRLAELGAVTHDVLTAEPDVTAALERFLEIEASGWKGRRGTAGMNCPTRLSFFRQAITALARDGKARIDLLRVGDRVIATSIALRSGNTLFGWKMAYDEGYAKYSPGAQLVLDLTKDVLADDDIARIDSCAAANHPMIDHLWHDRVAIADRMLPVQAGHETMFDAMCALESLRRGAINSVKAMRDKLRG